MEVDAIVCDEFLLSMKRTDPFLPKRIHSTPVFFILTATMIRTLKRTLPPFKQLGYLSLEEYDRTTTMAGGQIKELDLLRDVFINPAAQRALKLLYSDSQKEHKRNGKICMEIGMSREKDQGAVLKHFLGDQINLDLDNDLPEDMRVLGQGVSAKHSSSKVGTTIKAKWTSADTSAEEAIRAMIDAPDTYYPHLLLTYIDIHAKKITIVCIPSSQNKRIIKTMAKDAFTRPKGNSRGIEYSTAAMKELMASAYFKIEIPDADLDAAGLDPIQRRLNILSNHGI